MRIRARVSGTVQGVGFRPHVWRLARDLGLSGHVFNDVAGVELEVEGPEDKIDSFLARLSAEAPPLAVVEDVSAERLAPVGENGFEILASPARGEPLALVSPDMATCDACLAELFDPSDRRHRYPFLNCTDCGPRFTIVRGVPYDRPLTTMAGFEMCAACRAEYEDPSDRRFHAQPNACASCGPSLSAPLDQIASALAAEQVVAVKGVGGYHLACLASSEAACSALRARKHREDKPFALMAPSLESARSLVELSSAEEALLTGRERPIVIARRRPDAHVASSVAPASPDLGVMLPYSPLHHLLLADAGAPLVMTSGNVSDEPIAYDDADAAERLAGIADLVISHDRPIHIRTDDSVVRSLGPLRAAPLMVRRSRGYVPGSLALPLEAPPLLACGAELKSVFCVAKGRRAWPGHHIGDLKNYETLRSFTEGIEHFERLFAVEPSVVVHDLHPEYLSSKYAADRGLPAVAIQHHHAHLAAVLAEHGELAPAVGAIFDGSGFGSDGGVWGGEILVGDLGSFERAAFLSSVPLPGGDKAVEEVWRMALAWMGPDAPPLPGVDPDRWAAVASLLDSAPRTSSMGRLFDAVAALLGVRLTVTYEGQAAAELEALATRGAGAGAYPFEGLDGHSLIDAVVSDLNSGIEVETVAARFHSGVAAGTCAAVASAASARGLDTAVLSGGVFQNRLLLTETAALLSAEGMRVLIPEALPPNDGAIAYGQAAVCAQQFGVEYLTGT